MYKSKLSVGEPWDYVGPDGSNLIKGMLIKLVGPKCVIFKSDELLTFEGSSGYYIVLRPRYTGEDFTNLSYNIINGHLLFADDFEDMNEKQLMENSKYVIIGTHQMYL